MPDLCSRGPIAPLTCCTFVCACLQTLVIQPFAANGSSVFADGATLVINATASAGGCRQLCLCGRFEVSEPATNAGTDMCCPPSCPPAYLLTPPADGKTATASFAVTIARRPTCTTSFCLTVSPASGAVDTTAFVAAASGFAADSALVYHFGVQRPDGWRDYHSRGSADAKFAFAPRVLPAGDYSLFVCATGVWQGQGTDLPTWVPLLQLCG